MQIRFMEPKFFKHAFTLIEMLVVVTIIVLLMAFATPALMRTMQATRLSSTGDSLVGAISEAQQMAYARNLPVEIRFFSYSGDFGGTPLFRSYQTFKIVVTTQQGNGVSQSKETVEPLSNLINLSEGVVIAPDAELSPGLSGDQPKDQKEGGGLGYSGVADATYSALRFMPDGSCRKVTGTTTDQGVTLATLIFQTLPESFFTITYDIGAVLSPQNLPKNFYTIQIDPFTGKARSYKPGF